ncbi:MAG TPA: SUMF1/EgtB/PvdO family nonheme iron enzyme [Jatrophihabitans sp.]|nr:SUMF1/EgtB/PvdO family nonheme iron enzyme [Jatrophihabitans sp.]
MSLIDRTVTAAEFDLELAGSLNELSDRIAMGLPARLVERTAADLFQGRAHLLRADPRELVALVEDPAVPFADRLAAGRVLGLVGDPRCAPGAPQLVELPGGTVEIGLPADEVTRVHEAWRHRGVRREWIEKETPRHRVHLRPYRLARYPVTNLEYAVFLRETGHPELPTSWPFGTFCWERANEPVWTVTESAAQEYAGWLSRSLGRRFRLPTECEWEAAAAGPDGLDYPWGQAWLPDRANTVEDGPLTTTPVGCYPAGRAVCGAEDMAGNVEEWVADDYAPYPGGPAIEDDLAAHGSYRVARGGSFTRFADLARTRRRHGRYQRALYAIGFRLAEDLDDGGQPPGLPVSPAAAAGGDRSW